MADIQVLDKQTIDKIAAGEVVERPSSVVKELVENSLDAGATHVTVEIKEGGISYIRITDNGCGIDSSQIQKAFLRHSTSKIRQADDLTKIYSLGFRGEALSSIAAVSQVELITKTKDEFMGSRFVIEGGIAGAQEEIGAPNGTSFIIRNLFYNTPVRKKFLKTPQTEAAYITGIMEKYALCRPDVSFKVIVNGQVKLQSPGNGQLEDAVYRVFGREIIGDLLPIHLTAGETEVHGFIAKPVVSRGNRNFEHFFINGRYITSNFLSKCVEEAYKSFVMQHKFPFVLLNISMNPAEVDVNVHPTKMEVRFSNEPELYDLLTRGIHDVLTQKELIPTFFLDEPSKSTEIIPPTEHKPEPFERNKIDKIRSFVRETSPYQVQYGNRTINERPAVSKTKESSPVIMDFKEELKKEVLQNTVQVRLFDEEKPALLKEESKPSHRIIGQVFKTYWLVEFHDSMYIIDQHAAHERVLYERTMKDIKNKELSSQNMSPPLVLTLTDLEWTYLEKYKEQFENIGYSFEEFGGQDVIVNTVPYNMFGIRDKDLFLGMLDDLKDFKGNETPDIVLEKVAMMSCKAAVKGNQQLSEREAMQLIDDLLTLENPYHCPHGRPTIIEMSKYEMERKFKR